MESPMKSSRFEQFFRLRIYKQIDESKEQTSVCSQFVKEYSPKSLRNREGFWYNRRKPPREAPSWKSTPKTPAAKQWLLT